LKLVYLGTPEAAVPPLHALNAAGHEIALVVSQPDTRRGRGRGHTPSPVKAAATALGMPVTDRVDEVMHAGATLGVVVAFGQIIKPHVLAVVPMVNLHFSLLPRWRGAAPVERAILAGDTETGVAVMDVEEGLDTGGIYREVRTPIGADETAAELRHRLVGLGTGLLVEGLATGLGLPRPQVGEPTYAKKIDPAELRLAWERPARELHRIVRVGGAWTTFRGDRLKIHRAALVPDVDLTPGMLEGTRVSTGEGGLELLEVQPEGRGVQPAAAWRNGARIAPGEHLGS
jgi:methionyl-tRNA formyltransferase